MILTRSKRDERKGIFSIFHHSDSSGHGTPGNNKIIPVTIVSWSCNDRIVATAYENGLIKVWEPNRGTLINELKVDGMLSGESWKSDMLMLFRNTRRPFLY